MPKQRMHFEQVPLESIKNLMSSSTAKPQAFGALCNLCGSPVVMESCKSDECGRAVHESCYVASLERPRP